MKKEIKIELSEKELGEVLAEHFGLVKESVTIDIYKWEGNQREPSYSKVTITAPMRN